MNKKQLKLLFSAEGEELKKLSHEQVQELVHEYYHTSERVNDLINEYDLDLLTNQLIRSFPPVITSCKCPYDDETMVGILAPRYADSNDEVDGYTALYCLKCGHLIAKMRCDCDNCQHARKMKQDMRISSITHLANNIRGDNRVPLSRISLTHRLYLAALLRGFLSEDESFIYGVRAKPIGDAALAPSLMEIDDYSIISELFDAHVITIASNSSQNYFDFDEDDGEVKSFKPVMVNYVLNIDNPYDTHEELIHTLLYPSPDVFLADREFCRKLWRKINLAECKAYLQSNLRKVGFDRTFNPGKKTDEVITHLLDNFAASQIFGMIYNRVTHATRFYQEYPVSKRQAANSVITNLANYGERSLANHWKNSRYIWPYDLQRSEISKVFFDSILRLAEQGFHNAPTADI